MSVDGRLFHLYGGVEYNSVDKQLIQQQIEIAMIKKIEQEVIIEQLNDMLKDEGEVINHGKDFLSELKELCKLHDVTISTFCGQVAIFDSYDNDDIDIIQDHRIKNTKGTSST